MYHRNGPHPPRTAGPTVLNGHTVSQSTDDILTVRGHAMTRVGATGHNEQCAPSQHGSTMVDRRSMGSLAADLLPDEVGVHGTARKLSFDDGEQHPSTEAITRCRPQNNLVVDRRASPRCTGRWPPPDGRHRPAIGCSAEACRLHTSRRIRYGPPVHRIWWRSITLQGRPDPGC